MRPLRLQGVVLLLVPATLTLCAVTPGCASGDRLQLHIPNRELLRRVEGDNAPLILDVRSSWEFRRGHVPGAIHIPFLSTFSEHRELAPFKDKPIVVYCEHGPRAAIARFALRRAGFKKVFYLEGHMWKWRKASLPVERPDSQSSG